MQPQAGAWGVGDGRLGPREGRKWRETDFETGFSKKILSQMRPKVATGRDFSSQKERGESQLSNGGRIRAVGGLVQALEAFKAFFFSDFRFFWRLAGGQPPVGFQI